MRNYLTFTMKEFVEGVRAYKAAIFLAIFLIFGIMNPLVAKLTPDLISSLSTEGVSITLPEPAAIDSWMQFFKNISQMGIIVIVILFSGILTTEVSRGTLINMLTKGLSRITVILSKYTFLLVIWTVGYVLCIATTALYSEYLFPENSVENLGFALFALWLFGVLLLSLLMGAGSVSKSNYVCLLIVGACVVIMMVIGFVPATHDFNPLSLASESTALMNGTLQPESLVPAVLITCGLSMLSILAATLAFRKRQL